MQQLPESRRCGRSELTLTRTKRADHFSRNVIDIRASHEHGYR